MEEDQQWSEKSFMTAFMLCFFIGFLGAHRFYVGRHASGVLSLLTLGGFFIWQSIDSIILLNSSFKDAKGLKLRV